MGLIQIVSLQFPQDLVIIRDSRGRRLISDMGAVCWTNGGSMVAQRGLYSGPTGAVWWPNGGCMVAQRGLYVGPTGAVWGLYGGCMGAV